MTGAESDVLQLANSLLIGADLDREWKGDHRAIVYLLNAQLVPIQRYPSLPMNVDHLVRELTAFSSPRDLRYLAKLLSCLTLLGLPRSAESNELWKLI